MDLDWQPCCPTCKVPPREYELILERLEGSEIHPDLIHCLVGNILVRRGDKAGTWVFLRIEATATVPMSEKYRKKWGI